MSRKEAFKYYKAVGEEESTISSIDSALNSFTFSAVLNVKNTTVLTGNSFVKEQFLVQFNTTEEFFVLRGALSDEAVKFLYFNALLYWPTESCSRSHLTSIPEIILTSDNLPQVGFETVCS
nr:unnamed protein product [Spirometra erinaceieuropaei]